MVEKIREYYELEYSQTKRALDNSWCEPKDAIWYALQRCLGVAQFVQTACDVSFEVVEPLYEEFREKFEKLLDNSH